MNKWKKEAITNWKMKQVTVHNFKNHVFCNVFRSRLGPDFQNTCFCNWSFGGVRIPRTNGTLVEVCVCLCSCITRLTVVFLAQCFTMFCAPNPFLKSMTNQKEIAAGQHIAILSTFGRHLMDGWLNIFDWLYQTIFHAHPLARTFLFRVLRPFTPFAPISLSRTLLLPSLSLPSLLPLPKVRTLLPHPLFPLPSLPSLLPLRPLPLGRAPRHPLP